jgi:hypothetical protein
MTANATLATARPRRSLRRLALTASAGIVLTLLPVTTAGAETFIDPDDRCLPPLPGQPDEEVPPAPVADRDQITPVHQPSVDCLFEEGIATGFTNGTYGPMQSTTRGQMATFIINSLLAAGYDLPEAEPTSFTDIQGTTHEENIELLETIGVTNGTTATTYSPFALVRRDQMASYLVQAAEFAFGTTRCPPAKTLPSPSARSRFRRSRTCRPPTRTTTTSTAAHWCSASWTGRPPASTTRT